jgi:hypothetical protein
MWILLKENRLTTKTQLNEKYLELGQKRPKHDTSRPSNIDTTAKTHKPACSQLENEITSEVGHCHHSGDKFTPDTRRGLLLGLQHPQQMV